MTEVLFSMKTSSMASVGISAMRMRRKAFASEASMPTREKEASLASLRWNWMEKADWKCSMEKAWSSPGKWPGKSVEETFETVSLLMPTV